MHLTDLAARYAQQLRADGRSEHTVAQAERHVALLVRWLAAEGRSADAADLDHEDLALFLASPMARTRPDGAPKRATSLNALRSSLRTFFAYAAGAGHTGANPARLLRRARCGTPPPRGMSDDDQRRLLDTLASADGDEARRDHALFAVLLGCGLRISSALGLDVEDLDLDAGELWLRTTKGDRPERVYAPEWVVELLRAAVAGRTSGAVFGITRRHAARRLGQWLHRAGVKRQASPHALRHAFAMRLYGETGDIGLVQAALRHKSIAATMVYARPDEERVRAAVAGERR